ncbi:MAG: mechanosensitive ion channel [Planctomycetaceae bacterium]|nr:mechanosensitive ion channel [Planctomycetaceae bacterium]MBT4159003.1 mechanosensitive ion channel [Planctomycetaceae bacterium]MBT7728124.1 mechanosensitive ion channel [Planctomycetaceae bacterium]
MVWFALALSACSLTSFTTTAADTKPQEAATAQASTPPQQDKQENEQAPPSNPDAAKKRSNDPTPDADKIRDAIETVRTDNSLPEEMRTRCQEVLTNTLKDIECTSQDQQLMETLAQAAKSSEQRKKVAERLEDKTIDVPLNGVTADSDVTKIEEVLRTLNKQLSSTTAAANKIQLQLNERRTETKALPTLISQTEEELATLSVPAETEGENPVLTAALKQAALAKRDKLETFLKLAQQKITTYDAEAAVLPLEKTTLDKRAAAISNTITEVTTWVARRHTDEIKSQIATYRASAQEKDFGDSYEFDNFFKLLDQWPLTVANAESWSTQLLALKEKAKRLRADMQETTSLVDSDRATGSGLSRTAGYLLRRKHVMLNRERTYLNQSYSQGSAVDNAQDILGDIDTELDKTEQQLSLTNDSEKVDALKARKKILSTMSIDIDRCLVDILIPFGVSLSQASHIIDQYQNLIDTNLLWVRSDKPVRLSDIGRLYTITKRFESQPVGSIAKSFWSNVTARPFLALAFLLATVAMALCYRVFIRRITAISSSVNGSNAMRLWPTLQAVCFTVCAALPVWLALSAMAWFLGRYAEPESTEASISNGLWVAGLVFLPLEILRQLIRPHGVATAHFGWPELVIKPLGQAVRRIGWVGLTLVFLATFLLLERYIHREISALARIVFAILMLFIAGTLWRLLDTKSGVVAGLRATQPDSLIAKLEWIWRPFIIAIPVVLAGLSLSGYAYAAGQLTVSLYQTIWLVVATAVLQGIAERWLLVSKRRIALRQLKEQVAIKEQAEASGAAADLLDVNQMKLSAIDEQTHRLINASVLIVLFSGLLWIWSPVLPALSFLESIVLWQELTPDGTISSTVSLSNVLVALPTLLITFVLVRNTPGLLEALILQRLPLDNAARYALNTLISYVFAFCGVIVVAGTLGLRWSSVQWLAAGLSVGLGFGLQEVVANFVCGLIVLFEQPIRVGDVVTIDTVTGVVSRIRMRATTVTTYDRQEYVIPNKDLITGRVINWTLSDSVNRSLVRVGVAYGTDTRRVGEILREICRNTPHILKEPGPIVTFDEFGDSTLNFAVRFYLATLDNRFATVNELHNAIAERFAEENIEIAFPQMDVHMKSDA